MLQPENEIAGMAALSIAYLFLLAQPLLKQIPYIKKHINAETVLRVGLNDIPLARESITALLFNDLLFSKFS